MSAKMVPMAFSKLACMIVLLAVLGAPAVGAEDPWPGIREDYLAGRYDAAIAALERLIAERPHDREAFYYLGMIHWRLGDDAAASRAYRRVLELDPKGAFGEDARLWLASHDGTKPAPADTPYPGPSAPIEDLSEPPPAPLPSLRVSQTITRFAPIARPTYAPRRKGRERAARPRPGYFKAADGTFEFKPPVGFVLLDEGVKGDEIFTLFGPKGAMAGYAAGGTPPTLLIGWKEYPELLKLTASQRLARERQLLMKEAAAYGPGAKHQAYVGAPCFRVRQQQGNWTADTLIFFQHGRLYTMTFGGEAKAVGAYRGRVEGSWKTTIFYP